MIKNLKQNLNSPPVVIALTLFVVGIFLLTIGYSVAVLGLDSDVYTRVMRKGIIPGWLSIAMSVFWCWIICRPEK